MNKKTDERTNTTNDRRRPEASGLRALFASQLRYFLRILESPKAEADACKQKPSTVTAAIETVIDGTDKRIRAIGNYKKRLRATIGIMLDYIDTAVACLPDAIRIDKNSFTHHPQINAFFVSMEDMQTIFSRSPALQHFFKHPQYRTCDEACAVMFVSRNEKSVFGKVIQDDLIVSEVRQTAINFSEHEITAASDSEDGARQGLKEYVFEHIVNYVSAHMQQIRQQQQRQIDAGQTEINITGVCNPEVYLDELINQLSSPGPLLTCEKIPLRLNKMGIKVDDNSTETVNEFIAHEFRIGQQSPRIVTLVRYPRKAMLTTRSLF